MTKKRVVSGTSLTVQVKPLNGERNQIILGLFQTHCFLLAEMPEKQ